MNLKQIPWFLIVGFFMLFSMLLYTTQHPDFITWLLPTYLTGALSFIIIGYAFMDRDRIKQGLVIFLMAVVWLINQLLHWMGLAAAGNILAIGSWITVLIQLSLVGVYVFTDFEWGASSTWIYAGLGTMIAFGVAKLLLDIILSLPWQMQLWGVSIAILSSGYLLTAVDEDIAVVLQAFGTVLAFIAAFTIGGAGLNQLPQPLL